MGVARNVGRIAIGLGSMAAVGCIPLNPAIVGGMTGVAISTSIVNQQYVRPLGPVERVIRMIRYYSLHTTPPDVILAKTLESLASRSALVVDLGPPASARCGDARVAVEAPAVDFDVLTRMLEDVVPLVDACRAPTLEPDQTPALAVIAAVVEALDLEAEFVPPSWFSDRELGRVGIVVSNRGGVVTIKRLRPDSPGARADIRPGDVIESIDGESMSHRGMTDVLLALAGPVGSTASFRLRRGPSREALHVTVTREAPRVGVESRLVAPGVGYLNRVFEYSVIDEVADALRELQTLGADRVIIDLRGDTGTTLKHVEDVASMLLPPGRPLFTIEGRLALRDDREGVVTITGSGHVDESIRTKATRGAPRWERVAVLVDADTASGAEFVAAAVQDAQIGPVVGLPTAGRGLVETWYSVQGSAAVRLTTGLVRRPNGQLIHGRPIAPDVVVDSPQQDDDDPALARAMALLTIAPR